MKRLLLILVLGLAACGGDNSTPAVNRAYNDAAVQAKAVEMVSSNELLAPNGGPISQSDLASLFQIVRNACQSKENLEALTHTMSANPYLLAMTFKLIKAGCPDVMKALGVTVNG